MKRYLAYTLIEALVTCAVIGGLATGAYLIVSNVSESSARTKLEQDVRMVNRALKVYVTHGGSIPGGATGDAILARLRREAANPKVAGLKGSLIDPRMSIRWQSSREASGGTLRAYWDDNAKEFVLAQAGSTPGVKEFYLGDMPDMSAEPLDDRKSTNTFAVNQKWVWDYNTNEGATRQVPRTPPTGTEPPAVEDDGTNASMIPLDPPLYSEDSGTFPITWFPGTVSLSLPPSAPPTVAEIFYYASGSSGNGQWHRYEGPVTIEPGTTLVARTVTLDPDHYEDSGMVDETYNLTSLKLEIAANFPRTSFNYRELGGPMQGATSTPAPPFGTVTVTNLSNVPSEHITSDKFQIFWTFDGTDPGLPTSAGRIAGPTFGSNYSGTQVPITLPAYRPDATATIRIRAVALDSLYFRTSEEQTLSFGAEKLTLPGTTMSVSTDKVVMSPVTDSTRLPQGSRVFFKDDGSDPGSNNGEPAATGATLYTGPVTYPSSLTQYTARSYPPTSLVLWFNAGDPATIGTGATPDGYYFATTPGSQTLYQFDSVSGSNIVRSTECLFPPASVAYLTESGRVYYVQQSGGGWQLGRYDLATGTHASAGQLTAAGLDYVPTTQPTNLVGFNNSLYYVAEDTDDLVRVDFQPNGAIRAQYKFADVADDLMALHGVGDIVADSTGTLYVSAQNAWASFNLKSLNGFTVPVNNPAWVWAGMVAGTSGQIFGVRNTEPGKFYTVDKMTGTGSTGVTFTPAQSFDDFGGPLGSVPFQLPPGHFALTPGGDDILRLNLETGRQYIFASNIGMSPSALAADNAGGMLYATGVDPGNPSNILLKSVSIASGAINTVGSLTDTSLAFQPVSVPDALVWFNGALYYIPSSTSNLVKTTLSGGAISTQTMVADILTDVSIHPILGVVDGMTIGPDGQLYIASSNHHLLVSYDIANLAGFNAIKTTPDSTYTAITYRADKQMFGVPATNETTQRQIFSIDDTTGDQTFAKNVIPATAISDITGIYDGAATTVTADYFAVDSTTTRIYRFDPATGANAVLTSNAPWTMGALAYDGENQRLFYIKQGGTQVGAYNIATGVHTLIGNLNTAGFTSTVTQFPQNLTFFNGSLYFITPGTDNLMRMDLNQSGNIADLWKEADINGNIAFTNPGDIAVDGNGFLYISDGMTLARYDLKTRSGYTVLSTTQTSPFDSLFTQAGTSLHGLTVAQPRDIVRINEGDGTTSLVATTSPLRSFIDTASAQQRVNLTPAGGIYYASVNGKLSIYSLNVTSGALKPITASCPVAPEAVAYDSDNQKIYYTEDTANPTNIGLYQFDLTTQRHQFVGNLAGPGMGYPSFTTTPHNLVYFAGNLYTIPADDDLVRIDLTGGVLSGLTKFADVSGGTSVIGNAGAFAVDNTGTAWVSRDSGNLLAKFNFYTRSGYTVVNSTDARMTSLVFSGSNVLYGTHATTLTSIQKVDQAAGTRTAQATTSPALSIRDITGLNSYPQPTLPDCYAVGGDNSKIYKFDPVTGVTYVINANAPFPLNSIARDPVNNVLYYTENTTGDWRLGRYAISSATHSVLATIGHGTWTYPVNSNPGNLFFYGGNLYFIAPGSDDLVQIGLNSAGTAVTNVVKAADITEDLANLGNVGDVAVDSAGQAWVATGNNAVGKFSMVTLSGYTQLSSGQPNYASMLFTNSGVLYGSHAGGETNVYSINGVTGEPALSAGSFPSAVFWDMAGNETSVPYSRSNSLWALDENTGRLGEFVNWNLPNVVARAYGPVRYLSAGVSTAFPAGNWGLEDLAITSSGTAYFVRNEPTVIGGVTYKRPLFTFETSTLTFGSTPTVPVATFVGDLDAVLSVTGVVGDVADTDEVTGLTIGPDQRLYLLYSEGSSATTDYLFRINSFSATNGSLNNVSLIGQMTGSGEAVTLGQDMVFNGAKLNVADDADDKVYEVDPATGAISSVISSDTATKYEGMTVFPPTGEIVGANSDSGTADAATVRKIRPGAANDITRFNYATLSSNSLLDLEGLAFSGGTVTNTNTPPAPYYAVNRTNSIFRVDPETGIVTTATTATPFAMDAIALDGGNGELYYVQNSNTTIQLGKYTIATNAHTILGDLKLTGTFRPTVHPQQLIFYGGDLFYIAGTGTQTHLVRVQISSGAILAQDSLSRLSSTSSWAVTAAALDNNGTLYFREGTNLRSYDMRRLGNMATISSSSGPYDSLLFASNSGTFFGARSTDPTGVEPVNMSNGTGGTPVVTSPAISLYDMTGAHTAPGQLWVNTSYYAVGGNNQELYVIDPATGSNSLKTTTALFSGIAVVACDSTGDKAYYIQQGTPYTLAVYNRTTNTHTQIAQLANVGTVRPTSQVDNLTWFNGHLYWLQANTDNLYKIELKADGTFSDTFLVADIANNDEAAFGTVGDLAVDATGWLYISGTTRFAKYNLAALNGYTTLSLNPSYVWSGLMTDADGSTIYGVRNTEPGNLYRVNSTDGAGTFLAAFNATRSIGDLAAPQAPVTSLLTGQRYYISQSSTSVGRLDLATGRTYRITSSIPNQPAGIAHDYANNRLYLMTYTGASVGSPGTIRLVAHDLASGTTTDLASMSTGWTYNPTVMPQALVYAQNGLYYVAPNTDDLIKITLSSGAPTAQAKVADMNSNTSPGEVNALTVSPDGVMYISCSDTHLLAKYNLSALGGYGVVRATPKANALGLTYDTNNVLHSVYVGEDSSLYTVNTTTGAPTFKVASTSPIYDITGLNTDIMPAFSRSLWAISRNGTNHQLIEVKNWDVPASRTAVNWGNISYNNGSTWATMPTSTIQIYGLALSSSGVGYFTATGPTTISGSTYSWGLYKLDLSTLQTGVVPKVSFMGDLKPRLDALSPATGTTETTRWITGMTIEPSSGRLYGQMLDGKTDGADVIFTVNSLLKGSGNALTDLSIIGTATGTASATQSRGLAFDRNGVLYTSDLADKTVDRLNPATGANQGNYSTGEANAYSALCADPVSGAVIGTEFTSTNTRTINAGSTADTLNFAFSTNFSLGAVYGMSFLTWPIVLPETPPPLYYAVNNTTTLYSFNPTTGATTPLTPAAPFQARSVAHDPQNSILYYIENVSTGFRLAQYNLGNSTHTILGNLDTRATGTWSYDPTALPTNLEYSGGSLYYVHPNTDDLVRVFLNGTTIVDQVKIADLTANVQNFGGAVTELSIGSGNVLWISAANGLYKYNLGLLTGFATVATGSQYSGVFFDQTGNELYGTTFAAQTQVHAVNQSTGVMTAISTTAPSVSFEDFGAYPPVPPTPVGTYYAVNGTSTLYLMDQLTGGISAASAGAPYAMSAVCYDVDRNLVYYVQANTDTWNLGRYNPVTGVHTNLGRAAETGTYASPSGPQPNNLFVWNSQVFYIKPGTDDLMQVEMTGDASALTFYYKVADITGNATTFSAVGDVAVSATGMAYFASPEVVAKFDLKNMSGYQVIKATPSENWKALLMGADNLLYGISTAEPAKIYRIHQNTGVATFIADVSASLEFTDLGGRHPLVVPQPLNGQVYAAAGNSTTIHLVDVTAGTNRLITANAPFGVNAIAYDYDSYAIYYTEYSDTSERLGKYDLRTNRHTVVADLGAATWNYPSSARINNLVYSNGDLYYIHKNTDDLVRVTLNNGAVSDESLLANVTNNVRSLGDVGALGIDDGGYLYIARQDAPLFARYNMARRSRYTELNTTTSQFNSLVFVDGTLYGVRTAQTDRTTKLDKTSGGVVSTNAQTNPVRALEDLSWITPEFTSPTTRYYATDRTSTIYQVDPASGETQDFATLSGITAEAVAYDLNNDYVYYLETPGSGFRLGRYDADSSTNLILGSLQQSGFAYVPADQPKSMVYYNGGLYYIARNSDDLVKVTVSGGTISSQVKITDLSGNTASYDAAAMAINNSGQLFFRSGTRLYRCDLRNNGTGLVQISGSSPGWESLLFSEDSSTLYGAQTASLSRADRVSTSNGSATTGVNMSPAVDLYEMTGPNTAAAPNPPYYYASNGTTALYRINPATAVTTALSGTWLVSSTATSFDGIAYDQNAGVVYLVQKTDSSTRLGKYTIATGQFSTVGTFIDTTITGLSIPIRPYNLFSYQGALYFIRRSTSATTSEKDDLIRITFTSAGAISTMSKVADVAGNVNIGDVMSAAVTDSGILYFSTTLNALYSYDLRNLSTLTLISSSCPQNNGLLWNRETNTLYGAQNSNATRVNTINMGTAALGTPVTTNPIITISAMDGGNTAPPPPWYSVPGVYAVGDLSRSSDGAFNGIAKFTPEGDVDTSFNTGTGVNTGSTVTGLTRTSNGKVIIGGNFSTFNGVARGAVARINGDGSLDASFAPTVVVSAAGTAGTPYNVNWSTLGVNEDVALNGADTRFLNSSSDLHGLSTTGGFAGFGFQSFNNVGGSGVAMTLYYSQNMMESGGLLDGAQNGPNLFGPSGSGAEGGPHPDRRVVGAWDLRFNNDQAGTITPATVALSFSEPVFLNQFILGHLAQVAGAGSSFGANILTNGSFESGSWSSPGYVPSSTYPTKAPAMLNVAGTGKISNWNPDKSHWIDSPTRATNGNRFLYILPSDQSWNFCVGQNLTVGGPTSGRQLITGRTYRVRYSAVTFNPNYPTGVSASQGKPAVEFGWTATDGSSGFSELQNVREDATGLPATMTAASNWDALQWRHYTGYFVAPAVSGSNYTINMWLSMVKADTSVTSTTSGMLFDNVRLEEVLTTTPAFEHAFVRAYSTPDGTGTPVAADSYANLSAMVAPLLGTTSDPVTVGDANNVRMDNDTSNNVYHTIGKGMESENRHGKVSMTWANEPIRSIAISLWASSGTSTVDSTTVFTENDAFNSPTSLWTNNNNSNPSTTDAATTVGYSGTLTLAYKQNAADGSEAGTYASSYSINFENGGVNASAGVISYTGGATIAGNPVYLLVKGGNAPAGSSNQYFYDISTWNRTDPLQLLNYWPGTNSISHVSIYVGTSTSPPPGNPTFESNPVAVGVTASLSNLVFRRAAPLPGQVWAVAEQPDGKILIGGNFTSVNGASRKNIARLNPNGSTDTTFDAGVGPDNEVRTIELTSNGGILVGGSFNTWNGSSAGAKVVLLTSSGARNTGWSSPVSVASTDTVKWIKSTDTGVYIGGKFTAPRNGIARLNASTGANDTAFAPSTGSGTGTVNSGIVLDDNKVLVAGDFTVMNGTARNRIARLNTNGSLDTAFAPSPAFDSLVNSLLRLPGSGYAHAGGAFTTYNSNTRPKITVFNTVNGAAGTTTWGPTGMTINSINNIQ